METKLQLDIPKIKHAGHLFHTMTHPVRFHIIKMLEETDRLRVTQIIERTNVAQAEVSQYLIKLRNLGILNNVKEGRNSYYSLNRDFLEKCLGYVKELYKKD